MKIYFVRHGETQWNKERRLQGQTNIPLNENGRRVAELSREGIKDITFDIAYTSPLDRAKETAQILLAGRDIPIIEDDRLKEISFGDNEGVHIPELVEHKRAPLYQFICEPEQYVPSPEAESLEALSDRCREFLEQVIIPAEGNYETVMVAAHGALICSLISYLEGSPKSEFWNGNLQKNCGFTIVECKDGKLSLLDKGVVFYELI
ncbi:MAG TPA: histidine phosphatase family protein [Lachnospiraceae bacterium]|nr:histidine phosphatase family protein [Lachnospiraceae bacterium]